MMVIKEDDVAEEKAAKVESSPAPTPSVASEGKPIWLIALVVINMLVVAGVGFMLYKGKQKEAHEPTIDHVIKGVAETHEKEIHEEKAFVGKVVPLETFIVNLANSKGRKVAKVNMEIELKDSENGNVADEIEKRKAQVRDIIIILLSSKTYEEVSTREGKEHLRNEIKDTVNSFLTKGKITNVFFTEFIYN